MTQTQSTTAPTETPQATGAKTTIAWRSVVAVAETNLRQFKTRKGDTGLLCIKSIEFSAQTGDPVAKARIYFAFVKDGEMPCNALLPQDFDESGFSQIMDRIRKSGLTPTHQFCEFEFRIKGGELTRDQALRIIERLTKEFGLTNAEPSSNPKQWVELMRTTKVELIRSRDKPGEWITLDQRVLSDLGYGSL
jgi:hypothetical protein